MPKIQTPQRRRPKYLEIAEELYGEMASGRLRPHDRLPTFAELRRRFGATPTTANQAFGALAQRGLVVREPGRGIFVAPPTTRERTHTIGIVGRAFTQTAEVPYFTALIEGARQVAADAGVDFLLLGNNRPAPGWEKVDGILHFSAEDLLPVLPPGIACVSAIHRALQLPSVVADDEDGMRQATRHLLALGHRRIAYMPTTALHELEENRLRGYRSALHEAGVKVDPRWVRLPRDGWGASVLFDELGYAQTTRWLNENWRELGCTALMLQNDDMALGAIAALQAAGFAVPRDVSVVGFDGTRAGEYCHPRLTSVVVPLPGIGGRAARLLLDQIEGRPSTPHCEILPTKLVVRDSTAPPTVPH